MELALDYPDFPIGMLTDVHLKPCKAPSYFTPFRLLWDFLAIEFYLNCAGENVLLEFVEKLKSIPEMRAKAEALWADFSAIWFTLLPSTRPLYFRLCRSC